MSRRPGQKAFLVPELSKGQRLLQHATEEHQVLLKITMQQPMPHCSGNPEGGTHRRRPPPPRRPASLAQEELCLLAHACAQKAVEALARAQARLDHARGGAAAKQAARDAALAKRAEVEAELQVGAASASFLPEGRKPDVYEALSAFTL